MLYNEHDAYAAAWLRNLMDAGEIPRGTVDERSIAELQPGDVMGRSFHAFAGVGGWPLALRLAGWPEAAPVWSGSCPCQPFSSAGNQQGTDDERHLWPEFFRLIRSCRPPVVFGEQVASSAVVGASLEAAFVAAVQAGNNERANNIAAKLAERKDYDPDSRSWFDGICDDLEGEGCAVWACDLPACSAGEEAEGWLVRGDTGGWERIAVGAPHIRQRLFWCAISVDRLGLASIKGSQGHQRLGRADERIPSASGPWSDFRIIPCTDGNARRIGRSIFALAHGIPIKRSDPRLGWLVAKLVDVGHSPKSARRILAEARRNRTGRLKGMGNAIVPQVAAMFVRAVMEVLGDGSCVQAMPD